MRATITGVGGVVEIQPRQLVEADAAVEIPRRHGKRIERSARSGRGCVSPRAGSTMHRQARIALALPVRCVKNSTACPRATQQARDAQRVALHAAVREVLEQAEGDLHAARRRVAQVRPYGVRRRAAHSTAGAGVLGREAADAPQARRARDTRPARAAGARPRCRSVAGRWRRRGPPSARPARSPGASARCRRRPPRARRPAWRPVAAGAAARSTRAWGVAAGQSLGPGAARRHHPTAAAPVDRLARRGRSTRASAHPATACSARCCRAGTPGSRRARTGAGKRVAVDAVIGRQSGPGW